MMAGNIPASIWPLLIMAPAPKRTPPEVELHRSYLLLSISNGCEPVNRLWVSDLRKLPSRPESGALDLSSFDINTGQEKLPLQKFIDNFEASFSYVANIGTELILHTNLKAPRYR